jgi:cardiolipin synthase
MPDEEEMKSLKEEDLRAYTMVSSLKKNEPLVLYKNTRVTYFNDALEKHINMVKELKKAKDYIYMEYFIISAGSLMDEVYSVLEERGNAGVDIKIIYDDLGSKGMLNMRKIRALKRIKNCTVVAYQRVGLNLLVNYRDHRKICITDGRICYTGGDNLADEYIHVKERFGYWRDTACRFDGKAVTAFTNMFLSTWCRIRGTTIQSFPTICEDIYEDKGYVLPIWDGPTNGGTPGYDMFCSLFEAAEKYIYISTPYFIIDDAMIALLVRKIKAGVDVRILMPHHPDKNTAFYMGRLNYRDIFKAGGKIYEYTPGFNHAKNIIVDDKYAFIGTINMDYRSLFLHYECGALLMHNEEILKMKEDYLNALGESMLFDYKKWYRKKGYQRAIGYIFSLFAPLF